jgi:hypothetical protein
MPESDAKEPASDCFGVPPPPRYSSALICETVTPCAMVHVAKAIVLLRWSSVTCRAGRRRPNDSCADPRRFGTTVCRCPSRTSHQNSRDGGAQSERKRRRSLLSLKWGPAVRALTQIRRINRWLPSRARSKQRVLSAKCRYGALAYTSSPRRLVERKSLGRFPSRANARLSTSRLRCRGGTSLATP